MSFIISVFFGLWRWLTVAANMRIDVKGSEGGVRPIVDASRGGLRTQTGRLAKSDGADNEKYGVDPY